jgi:hypothetical protein
MPSDTERTDAVKSVRSYLVEVLLVFSHILQPARLAFPLRSPVTTSHQYGHFRRVALTAVLLLDIASGPALRPRHGEFGDARHRGLGARMREPSAGWRLPAKHMAKLDISLSRLRDVLMLISYGALISTMVSASIGVTVLFATHVQPWSGLGFAWIFTGW